MSEHNYRTFTTLPANWTRAIWDGGRLANQHDPYKWSGSIENDPPAIGSTIKVYMNGLGTGTVTSYFVEDSWLGVLVDLDAPPAWYVKQNGAAKKVAHVFGVDLSPFTRKIKENNDV